MKIKSVAQKLLKQFTNSAEVSKDEALNYVEQVLRVANVPFDNAKFDRLVSDKPTSEQLLKVALEMANVSTKPPLLTSKSETSIRTQAEFEKVWRDFDPSRSNVLDKIEAFKLVQKVLARRKGDHNYTMVDFDSWFDKTDTQGAGVVEKAKLLAYVQRMSKFEKSFTGS